MPPVERSAPSGVDDVVKLALAVPGVVAVRVEPAGQDGASLVRLELGDDVAAATVAAAMDEALARRPPTPRRSVEDAAVATTASEPARASGQDETVPSAPGPRAVDRPASPVDALFGGEGAAGGTKAASRPRTGRISVPSVTSPTIAATPAPAWLNQGVEDAEPPSTTPVGQAASAAPEAGVESARESARTVGRRWILDRLDVGTDRLTTRASVTLTHSGTVHTGIAEAPATAAGGARAVAAATVRAVESAVGDHLRADVEAVSLTDVAGHRAALVVLDLAAQGGPEQLLGAALVDRDEHRGIVKAVLDAANRRLFRHS